MSLEQVKVARTDVLKIVQENKEKHDGILKTAIDGYWIDAENFLKKFEKETIEQAIKNHKAQLKNVRKEHKAYVKAIKTKVKEDLEKARRNVVFYTQKHKEHVAEIKKSNMWLKQLRKSL